MNLIRTRLFIFLLSFYLKKRQEELDLVDSGLVALWRARSSLAQDEHEQGWLSLEEMNCEWSEIDREMASWDNRLADWREERWHLRKLLEKFQRESRRFYAAA